MSMKGYHFKFSRQGISSPTNIVAIDTEWAKNWRAVDKFRPFCFSIHSISDVSKLNTIKYLDIDEIGMASELYFRGEGETVDEYLNVLDETVGKYFSNGNIIIGHQISSDLHSVKQHSSRPLPNIETLIKCYKQRKSLTKPFRLADTRYDIANRVTGNGEERLRSVSLRLNVFAVQNEIEGTSLTGLYNRYVSGT